VLSLLLAATLCWQAPPTYDLRKDVEKVRGQPFERYFTHDRFGREITFFVTESRDKTAKPLAVYVQGSGDGSNFVESNGRVLPQNGFMNLYDESHGALRLLIVEKPGVKFLDQGGHGSAENASAEFKQEHTLDRWAEAVSAALRASHKIDGIDRTRILVAGHSEGGLVACRVAAQNPEVSHVATLAGGGVTQLYDLVSLARRGVFAQGVSDDPEKRVEYLLSEWKKVLADPDASDKLFLGHPYRRWSSFLSSSPIEELASFQGKIFIAQGVDDGAVDVSSADALYAQLIARGKDVTYDRLAGCDHVFSTSEEKHGEGWPREMKRLCEWMQG
jgi:predicted esterase